MEHAYRSDTHTSGASETRATIAKTRTGGHFQSVSVARTFSSGRVSEKAKRKKDSLL